MVWGLWEYVLGGASVFGLIVAAGAWINGRLTRREISRLIEKEHQATRELISKIDERMVKMDERFEALLLKVQRNIKQCLKP